MAFHSPNPVREQLKAEILSALSATQDSLTTSDLYHACRSATSPDEIAKIAFDMKKKIFLLILVFSISPTIFCQSMKMRHSA